MTGWIGVDLDGTLAHYDTWEGPEHIGAPIAPMVERVKAWIEGGRDVRVFTARAFRPEPGTIEAIQAWTHEHLGTTLPVTCTKDYGMVELWDDRAVSVEANTGRPLAPSRRGLA
jgi:hypothetical protein